MGNNVIKCVRIFLLKSKNCKCLREVCGSIYEVWVKNKFYIKNYKKEVTYDHKVYIFMQIKYIHAKFNCTIL